MRPNNKQGIILGFLIFLIIFPSLLTGAPSWVFWVSLGGVIILLGGYFGWVWLQVRKELAIQSEVTKKIENV